MYSALWDQLSEEFRVSKRSAGAELPDGPVENYPGKAPPGVDASDIYSIEAATFRYLSDRELRLRIIAFRGMLANLMTAESYAALSTQFSRNHSDRQSLLDEAHALASRLYRRYVLVPAVEDLKGSIVLKISVVVFVATVATLGVAIWQNNMNGYLLAAIAGAIGAAVSTLMRLNNVDPKHEPLLTWLNLERGRPSLWVTPALGAVFGFMFLLLVRANILSGELFPNFEVIGGTGLGLRRCARDGLVRECTMLSGDLAKLLIWGFTAGWAERMVPDVVSRLSSLPMNNSRDVMRTDPVAPSPSLSMESNAADDARRREATKSASDSGANTIEAVTLEDGSSSPDGSKRIS